MTVVKKKTNKMTKFWLDFFDIVSFFLLALGILLCIRFFIVNPFTVVGSSMETTYSDSDFILVDKITSQFWTYKRGDVIVFIPPHQDKPFIKRIIWLPWETVKLEDGKVFICNASHDCQLLDESYLPKHTQTFTSCNKTEFPVMTGYFVLWDNRWGSTDSRCCFNPLGCIDGETYETPINNIVWRVFIRMFPNFWFVN